MNRAAVPRAALALLSVGFWSVSLQVGGSGLAFADAPPAPAPIVDPFDPGQAIDPTTDGLLTLGETVATDEAGTDVAATAGASCGALGSETLGAACIASLVVAGTCIAWTKGCAAIGGVLYKPWDLGHKLLIHFGWGGGHVGGTPAPPEGGTWGTVDAAGWAVAYSPDRCDNTASGSGCLTVVIPDGAYCVDGSGGTFIAETSQGDGYDRARPISGCSGEISFNLFSDGDGSVDVTAGCLVSPVPPYPKVGYATWGTPASYDYDQNLPSSCYGGTPYGSPDGSHQWTTTSDCSDGTTQTATSSVFHDSDDAPAAVPLPGCPDGAYVTHFATTDTAGSGGTALTGPSYTAPSSWGTPDDPYADCDPGGSDLPCQLVWQVATDDAGLTVDVTGSSTRWAACTAVGSGCPDLASYLEANDETDDQASTLAIPVSDGTETFRCEFGHYHVPVSHCAGEDLATSPPDTVSTPGSVPDSDNCFPTGFGVFNPVEWVEKPVKCALEWAFEPTTATQTVAQLQGQLSGRAPWSYLSTGVSDVQALVAGWSDPGSACVEDTVSDPVFHFDLSDVKPWCVLQSSDGQGIYTVSLVRGVATAGIGVAFLWACYHRAKRIIGDSGPNDPSAEGAAVEGFAPVGAEDPDGYVDGYQAGWDV